MEKTHKFISQLYQTTRIISKGLNQRLETYGISSSDWAIIAAIRDNEIMSQVVLAEYLHIEPAAISKSLVNLERKGLVHRREGVDKREKTVFLTEEALRKYSKWEEIVGQHRKQLLSGLCDDKLNELHISLEKIFSNAQHKK